MAESKKEKKTPGLRERPDGSWQICISDGRKGDGSRRRMWKTLPTKREALHERAKMMAAKYEGRLVERSDATVAVYLENYLDKHADVSPTTLERYRGLARLQIKPHIGGVRLQDLRPSHLTHLYATLKTERGDTKKSKKGLSSSTIRQVHALIHVTLEFALTDGIITRNVASAVTKPKGERYLVTMSMDAAAIAKVLAAVRDTPLYVPVLVAALTGMRRGELLALRWANVDLDKKRLTVCESLYETDDGSLNVKKPKNGKSRTIAIDSTVCEALEEHRREQARTRLNALVFPAPEIRFTREGMVVAPGGLWSPSVMSGKFKRAVGRRGVNMRFHDLRHACASMMVAQGVQPKVISDRLGHSGIAITMDLYAHLMADQQEEAATRLGDALRREQGKKSS